MEEREIDLLELWHALTKHLLKIITIGVLFGAVTYAVSTFFIVPKYQATTSMIIGKDQNQVLNTNDPSIQINDLRLSQELVDTYSEIVKTRGVVDTVIKRLDLDMSYETLSKKIDVVSKKNTEIFEVTVVDTIPARAQDIANETARVFKDAVVQIMKIDNVQILDAAIEPTKPISPNILKNTVIAVFLGLVVAVFIFVTKEMTDTAIKTPEDITDYFEIPVIGVIPDSGKRYS